MALLQFDARTVAPQVSLEPIPQNWYKVAVIKSNIKPTSAGDSGLLELICQVLEGQYQGRLLYYNLNIFNKSQQATEIAYKQLSALCHVVGQYQVQDQNAPDHAVPMLHNIPFYANVVIAQGTKGPINNIVGLRDVNGNEPGKQGMGPQGGMPGQQPGGFGAPAGAPPGGFQPQQAGPAGGMAPGGAHPGGWQAPPNQAPGWGGGAPAGGPQPGPGPQQWGPPQGGQPGPGAQPQQQQWGPPNTAQPTQPAQGQPGGWTTGQPAQQAQPPQQQQQPQQGQPQQWTPGQNQQPQPGQFQPPPGPGGGAPPNAPWSR
jgi:uncharacterized protein DUF669